MTSLNACSEFSSGLFWCCSTSTSLIHCVGVCPGGRLVSRILSGEAGSCFLAQRKMFFQSCSIYAPEAVLLSTFAFQVDLVSDGEEPPQIPAKDYRLAFKVLSSEGVVGRGGCSSLSCMDLKKKFRLVAITMSP